MESETLYSVKGEVPDDPDAPRPDGRRAASPARATTSRSSPDSRWSHVALEAAADAREGGHRGRGHRPALAAPARRRAPSSQRSRRPTARRRRTRAGRTAASARRSPTASSASPSTSSTRPSLRVDARSTSRCPTTRSSSSTCIPQPQRDHRGGEARPRTRRLAKPRETRTWPRSSTCRSCPPRWRRACSATWHKKEGDAVAVDDLLAEVETDKATMEFRVVRQGHAAQAPRRPRAASVKLGQPVAILGQPARTSARSSRRRGGAAAAPSRSAKRPQAAGRAATPAEERRPTTPAEEPARGRSRAAARDEARDAAQPSEAPRDAASREGAAAPRRATRRAAAPHAPSRRRRRPANGERVKASPYVRKVARERGLDLAASRAPARTGASSPRDLETCSSAKPQPREPRRRAAVAAPRAAALAAAGGAAALA